MKVCQSVGASIIATNAIVNDRRGLDRIRCKSFENTGNHPHAVLFAVKPPVRSTAHGRTFGFAFD